MQIKVRPLIAKNYIKVPKDKELLECSICYDKVVDLMRCVGPCHQPFCLVCLSNIKRRSNACPSRCSKRLDCLPIVDHKVSFDCPYNRQICKTIQTVDQFKSHIWICQYMNEEDRRQLQNKKTYSCIKGHKLAYLNQDKFEKLFQNQQYYEFTQKQWCVICHEQRISNTICTICDPINKNQFYCLECRPVPCGQTKCRFGHRLEIDDEVDDYETLCDFCGASILLLDKWCFEDSECDFDICKKCHSKLPANLISQNWKEQEEPQDSSSQSD